MPDADADANAEAALPPLQGMQSSRRSRDIYSFEPR
jgi:hypothetical protein